MDCINSTVSNVKHLKVLNLQLNINRLENQIFLLLLSGYEKIGSDRAKQLRS